MTRIQKLLVKIGGDSKGAERAASRTSAALKRIQTAGKRLMIGVRNLAIGFAALVFAGKRLFLDKFAEQQDAVISLRAALAATGKGGAADLALLTAEAARLQGATTAADEALIAASATVATLAPSLNAGELAKAQTAIVAIADTFMKGDLAAAALQVGKTLGSATNSLSRYGFTIKDVAAPASEKLAELMGSATMGAAFAVSEAKATSLRGRMIQLSNAIGDLQEVGGFILATVTNLTGRAGGLTVKIQELTKSIEADSARWVGWIQVVGKSIVAAGSVLKSLVVIAFNVGQMIGRIFDIAAMGIALSFVTAGNALIRLLNKIPGVNLPETNAEGILERIRIQSSGLVADMEGIGAAATRSFRAVQAVGEAAAMASLARGSVRTREPAAPPPPPGPTEEDVNVAAARLKRLEAIAKRAFTSTRTSAEQLELEIRELTEAFVAGTLDGETYARAIAKAEEKLASIGPTIKNLGQISREFATDFAVNLANATAEGFESFRAFADHIIAELKRIAIKMAIFKGLQAIFGGGTTGILGSIGRSFGFVSGGKAHGGPVFPGRSYTVGERGPETFTSPTAGRIRRSDEAAGGAAGATVLHASFQFVTTDGRVLVDGITQTQQLDKVTKRSMRVGIPAALVPVGG